MQKTPCPLPNLPLKDHVDGQPIVLPKRTTTGSLAFRTNYAKHKQL